MKNTLLRRLLAALSLAAFGVMAPTLTAATQTTFFVSPTGNDANNGKTPASSFATVTRARDAVRLLNQKMTGDIVVEVAKGDYPLSATMEFTERDSGSGGFKVIYKNHDAVGSARFLGGTRVKGWKPFRENIFQADIGANLDFTTLYENGVRADLARWPKRTSPFATSRAGYMTFTEKKGETLTFFDSAQSPDGSAWDPKGKDFSQAWVYVWQGGDGHRWCSATTGVTFASLKEIGIKNCGLGWPPDNFIIEGSLGLLTRPGEYFYDKVKGTLYYISRFRGPLEQQEIIAPKLVRLLDITGASGEKPAENIQFSGLTFFGTDRIAQSGMDDWVDKQQSSWDASIYLKNAQNVSFENIRVTCAGVNGITFFAGVTHCSITGSLIEHTGYQGIDIFESAPQNTVENCLVRYTGELRGHGRGVNALGEGSILKNIEVYYAPRAGVCLGKKAVVSYVKVHDCVQDSGDQGGFYICGNNDATFNQCTSFHNYGDLSNMDRPPTAIYNDRDAANTVWQNIDGGDSQMFTFRHDPQKEGTLTFINVNWDPACNPKTNEIRNTPNPLFDRSKMEYAKIGITPAFPAEFRDFALPPVAPQNIWTQIGHGEITLHWTQVDRATSYTIKRAVKGGQYTRIASNPVPATGWDTGTTFKDTGLVDNTTYFYVITASNAAGESPPSLEQKATPNLRGSNKLTGKIIGEGNTHELALDGKWTTYFDTDNGWAGLELTQPTVITEVRYSPRSDNTDTTARMSGSQFQGANDPQFSKPVTLFTILGSKGGAGTPVLIPEGVFQPQPFRYVRLIGKSGKCLVGEIEFSGYPAGSNKMMLQK